MLKKLLLSSSTKFLVVTPVCNTVLLFFSLSDILYDTAVVRNLPTVTDSSAHHNPKEQKERREEALTEIYFIST